MKYLPYMAIAALALYILTKKSQAASPNPNMVSGPMKNGMPLLPPSKQASSPSRNPWPTAIRVSTWGSGVMEIPLDSVDADGHIHDDVQYEKVVGLGPSPYPGVPGGYLYATFEDGCYYSYTKDGKHLFYAPTPAGESNNWWDAQWVKDAEAAGIKAAESVALAFI